MNPAVCFSLRVTFGRGSNWMPLVPPVLVFTACVPPHWVGIAAVGGGSGGNLCSSACVSRMVSG